MNLKRLQILLLLNWMFVCSSCMSDRQYIRLQNGALIDQASLRSGVSVAVVWEQYSRLGESPATIREATTQKTPIVGWISSFSPTGGISVYLDNLRWRIDLVKDNRGQWVARNVNRAANEVLYEQSKVYAESQMEETSKPALGMDLLLDQPMSHVTDEKSRVPLIRTTFWILSESVEDVCSTQPCDRRRGERIVSSVVDAPDTQTFLKEHIESVPPTRKLWISPEIYQYPYVYYYMDGIPYLGIVEHDHLGRVLHHELIYIKETPQAGDFKHIVERLHEVGSVRSLPVQK